MFFIRWDQYFTSNVVKTTDGKFYDKNEIAKAFGVDKTAVTQQMIDRYIIPVAPTSENTTTTNEVPKSETSDNAVVIDDTKIVTDENGNQFLKDDTKAEGEGGSDDVKVDDKKAQGGMSKTQKIILWGGIGLVVVIIGVVVYRKMSSKGKGK